MSDAKPAMQLERVAIDALTVDPANVRGHSGRNLEAIAASLRAFGQQRPIVVDRDGVVIAGNGTLLAARQLGWTHIDRRAQLARGRAADGLRHRGQPHRRARALGRGAARAARGAARGHGDRCDGDRLQRSGD